MPVNRHATVTQRLLQAPVAALGQMHLGRVEPLRPAQQLARQRTTVIGIIQSHVVNLDAPRAQSLGKMAHGAEDQGDLLRVMRHMTGLFHHFGQQHVVVLAVDVLQCTEAMGKLVTQDQNQTARTHSGTISIFGWRRRWPIRM